MTQVDYIHSVLRHERVDMARDDGFPKRWDHHVFGGSNRLIELRQVMQPLLFSRSSSLDLSLPGGNFQ